MKLLGNLLLTVSLVAAMLSAATSYVAFLDGAVPADFAKDGERARLKAPAGANEPSGEDLAALAARRDAGEVSAEEYVAERRALAAVIPASADEGGTRLDEARLDTLRSAGVDTVFLKDFALGRWRFAWVFALSAIGLLAGSLMVRRADKAAIASAARDGQASPGAALDALAAALAELDDRLEVAIGDDAKLELVREHIDAAQRTHLVPFIEGRPLLVGRLGMGGYAELMDRFATGERQLNRAWSAASDGVLEEALDCLDIAREWIDEARLRLAAG